MRIAGSIVRISVVWLTLEFLWLAYTNSLDVREIIAGAVASGFAAGAVLILLRKDYVRFRFRLIDLIQAAYLPGYAISGTVKIFHFLGSRLFHPSGTSSAVGAVSYESNADDPRSVGRRALATTYNTATPNLIVLGIDREKKLMLFHEMVRKPVGAMAQKLGARP